MKVRENRARRAAARQELALVKRRRRDWRAPDFNTWSIVDPSTGMVVSPAGCYQRLTIDQVEGILDAGRLGEEIQAWKTDAELDEVEAVVDEGPLGPEAEAAMTAAGLPPEVSASGYDPLGGTP
jgi:hypothetical protein